MNIAEYATKGEHALFKLDHLFVLLWKMMLQPSLLTIKKQPHIKWGCSITSLEKRWILFLGATRSCLRRSRSYIS